MYVYSINTRFCPFPASSELGANGNRKQVLVSNCQTTEVNGGPSFEVTLDPVTQMITFTGRSATETSVVELQYVSIDVFLSIHYMVPKNLLGIGDTFI